MYHLIITEKPKEMLELLTTEFKGVLNKTYWEVEVGEDVYIIQTPDIDIMRVAGIPLATLMVLTNKLNQDDLMYLLSRVRRTPDGNK